MRIDSLGDALAAIDADIVRVRAHELTREKRVLETGLVAGAAPALLDAVVKQQSEETFGDEGFIADVLYFAKRHEDLHVSNCVKKVASFEALILCVVFTSGRRRAMPEVIWDDIPKLACLLLINIVLEHRQSDAPKICFAHVSDDINIVVDVNIVVFCKAHSLDEQAVLLCGGVVDAIEHGDDLLRVDVIRGVAEPPRSDLLAMVALDELDCLGGVATEGGQRDQRDDGVRLNVQSTIVVDETIVLVTVHTAVLDENARHPEDIVQFGAGDLGQRCEDLCEIFLAFLEVHEIHDVVHFVKSAELLK